MPFAAHPGSFLKRDLKTRELSANRLALALGVPSGRITDILNGRRSITADAAVRLGRYFGNHAQFWLDVQMTPPLSNVNAVRRSRSVGRCMTGLGIKIAGIGHDTTAEALLQSELLPFQH